MQNNVDDKKIIIFGAGGFGAYAINYFGEDQVYCFVDNNSSKHNTVFCNKKIISYNEYLKIFSKYKTIIAANAYPQIASQLQKDGIDDFDFYSPRFQRAVDKCENYIKNIQGPIALFGIDDYTELVIKHIQNLQKEIVLCEKDSFQQQFPVWHELHVYTLAELSEKIQAIIISAGSKASALQIFCEREIKNDILIINPFIQKKYYDTKEIIYSNYAENNSEKTEDDWNMAAVHNPDKKAINEYVEELNISKPLFEHVEIETLNRCNGTCDFCPVSAGNDIREKKVMDEKLFKKIVDELSDLNYSGRFATFSNNEPFLDSRIIEFNGYAREKLPRSRIHLFTNGTLLTLDKFMQIIPFLDELIIDNYNQDLELIPNCKVICEYCDTHPELKEKVTIVLRKPHEILTSRGGDAPNRKKMKSFPDIRCAYPFKQIIIRPDGKVSLCCNDPYGRMTLGDLTKESIRDVWYGKKFEEVREKLYIGRGELEHCKNCDTFSLY